MTQIGLDDGTDSPLNLDISQFVVEGWDMVRSVDVCTTYYGNGSFNDGEKKDGRDRFLPGARDIDITLFLGVLQSNRMEDMPVFAGVSSQQSSPPSQL